MVLTMPDTAKPRPPAALRSWNWLHRLLPPEHQNSAALLAVAASTALSAVVAVALTDGSRNSLLHSLPPEHQNLAVLLSAAAVVPLQGTSRSSALMPSTRPTEG